MSFALNLLSMALLVFATANVLAASARLAFAADPEEPTLVTRYDTLMDRAKLAYLIAMPTGAAALVLALAGV